MRQQLPRKSGKTLRKGRLSPMRLFDVLGPVMIGPSSSHTAGAAKIGYTAQKLLGEVPAQADIGLYGSFATTGKGHGTDRALVAGLLGMRPDDPRLPRSFELAKEAGMDLALGKTVLRGAHPNTVLLRVKGGSGREMEVVASSLGGGRVKVCSIDGLEASFTGDLPTLIIRNRDKPGMVAEVTGVLSRRQVNIAAMQLYRDMRGGLAVMVIESAERFGLAQLHQLRGRVGRGGEQSYCILMTGNKLSTESRARIETMVQTNDGFKIAEADMRLRGDGDLMGLRQSGVSNLKIADLFKDGAILEAARKAAQNVLFSDPDLLSPANAPIRAVYDGVLKGRALWSYIS